MTWAADAVANPDPGELAASGCTFIGRYLGTAFQAYGVTRDYVDACHAAGVGVLLIMEEWGSQFLGGYGAATACAGRMLAAWDALGAPRDGTVIPAVVLVDPNPGVVNGNEGALQDFARGWHDALTGAGFREWTGYGSRYGLDLAAAVAPSMTRRWGVRTWGFADGAADLIQEPNVEAPVARCDYNTVNRPDMGQWGGATPVPPKKKGVPEMWIALAVFLDGVHAFRVGAGGILWEYDRGTLGAYGIPQAALDDANNGGLIMDNLTAKPAHTGGGTAWDALVRMTEHAQGIGTVTPGDCPPGLDDATGPELYEALRPHVQ